MNQNDKQERIAEAEKFFNLLFGNVREEKFGYLWTKQDKRTYPFTVSNPDERAHMAIKAIELNDTGKDTYVGINLLDTPTDEKHRARHETVTLQTAVIADIDIRNERAHKGDPNDYPPTFDVAKSFLPFDASLLVDSGYGLHAYFIFEEPLKIDNSNRDKARKRNQKFIGVVRKDAKEFDKAVDGTSDLARVLRCPGTRNYKLGVDFDAPICHVVEVNDIRFTPSDMDTKLTTAAPARQAQQKSSATDTQQDGGLTRIYSSVTDSQDYDQWRAQKMLEVIPVADLTRDQWVDIGMTLKNIGNACSDWELWSRPDNRYHNEECEKLWQGFNRQGKAIGTIHDIAKIYGYSEKSARREWYQLHPELATKKTFRPAPMDDGEDDEPDENFTWTQERIKSCPVNLRLPHNFIWDKRGVTLVVPAKKNPKYICAAHTPIIPTRKFREPIKGTVEYEFTFLSDGKWRMVEVDGATLGDIRATKKVLREHDVLIEDANTLNSFFNAVIALNSAELPKINSYKQTGWTTDDCKEFAYPLANENAIVRRAGYDYEKIFKPKGDSDAWLQKFGEVTKLGGAVARVVIGAACAAPLVRPLKIPNIQVHLHGKKSIGKTPMEQFAVSPFGNPCIGALSRTFDATAKNRTETACAFRDLPVICEELESISAKDAEKLSQDIYNFYLGIGGQAQKRDGTAREPKLFSGTRLTTGEHSLVHSYGNGGEFKRVLELHATALLPEDFASELYGFCERNHGLFGWQWIQYISKNRDDISKHYHQLLKAATDAQKGKSNENDRTQLSTLIICLVAYQHFKTCIGLQEQGNLNELDADYNAVIKTLPTAADIDDATRAIKDLSSYVAAHEKSFIRDTEGEDGKPGEITSLGVTTHGKIFDNGEVVFFPTELKKILEDELHYISAEKIIGELAAQDKLITATGRTTHLVRIGKKTYRTIHFKAGIISKDSDSAELDYYTELGVFDE